MADGLRVRGTNVCKTRILGTAGDGCLARTGCEVGHGLEAEAGGGDTEGGLWYNTGDQSCEGYTCMKKKYPMI